MLAKPEPPSRDQQIVADDRLALHLMDVVVAPIADVLLDDVQAIAVGAVGEDARIVRIVNAVAANPVVVRALLDFDAVPLRPAAVVHVIVDDQLFATTDEAMALVVGMRREPEGPRSLLPDMFLERTPARGRRPRR